VDVGVGLAEGAEDAGEEALAGGDRGEEGDGAGERGGAGTTQALLQLAPALEGVAGVGGEALALGGQLDRALVPLQQGPADVALQALHQAGQR
jgi:hypothetical protein